MRVSELNVLIVEDDEFQRKILSGILGSLGVASIAEAGNGRQALEIIRRSNTRRVSGILCKRDFVQR